MKYKISRTSGCGGKPCVGAYESVFPFYDVRAITEVEFNERGIDSYGKKWRDRGTEHKVLEDGCISRRLDDMKYWAIDIEDLNEFVKDIKEEVIISYANGIYKLEIYDDYRE